MITGLITFAVCLVLPFLQSLSECILGQVGEYIPEIAVTAAVTTWLYKVRARPIRMGKESSSKKAITPPPSPKPVPRCMDDAEIPAIFLKYRLLPSLTRLLKLQKLKKSSTPLNS